MTRPPLELQEGQLVRVEYQEGRTQWWWAHYDDASVRPGEIGMLLGRTSDRWFENYRVRLIGRGHDVTFATWELNPCDLAAENAALRAQAKADDLTRAAAAYREACAPLDSLRTIEAAAYAACRDHLGHWIGTHEQHRALTEAIDAVAEQEFRAAQASKALRTAALAQTDAQDGPQ